MSTVAPSAGSRTRHTPVLLYDGECGFCARSVPIVLRHDRHGSLKFAPLRGRYGSEVRHRHPELAGVDSMVWVEPAATDAPERVFVRSAAALRIARYLDGFWQVARHRHTLAADRAVCFLPPAEVRDRFLD